MQIPPYLQVGDTIGITCPAGFLTLDAAEQAKETLESMGYKVILGKTTATEFHYFSAPDEVRLQDLQFFLDHPDVSAILMGRGGYGLSRIVDDIDFSSFSKNPKWIWGFSDITVLHSHINSLYNIATLHAPMCSSLTIENRSKPFFKSVFAALSGSDFDYPIPTNVHNKQGVSSGILVGGNLCMLAHLSGSISELDTDGKILFIEDVGEYLYNLDRMLMNLKRAGKLKNLKGLICGAFSDSQDTTRPLGMNICEIVLDKVVAYNYPVCFDFPAGHIDENFGIIFGAEYQLEVTENQVTLIKC